jgi:hypothetical protein
MLVLPMLSRTLVDMQLTCLLRDVLCARLDHDSEESTIQSL